MNPKEMPANRIARLITADPGIPRSNPTDSYWQRVPSPLANVKSTSLPDCVDFVIIGSGITGASVSKAILESNANVRIALLEARTLCSGATGRNGGQLATNAGESYASLAAKFGPKVARQIVQLTFDTVDRMRKVIQEHDPDHCDFQNTTKVRSYLDEPLFQAAKESIQKLEFDHPDLKGMYRVVEASSLKQFGVSEGVGGILHSAGTVWPYRLITRIFEKLLQNHSQRFSIDTETPVTAISHEGTTSRPYLVKTPRGLIRCSKVIHCTNGYAGHLLPGLRGRTFPICGSMSVQNLEDIVPKPKTPYSWAFHYPPYSDPITKTVSDGLNYLARNPKSNLFFFGGDNSSWENVLHADDRQQSPSSTGNLLKLLPFLLAGKHRLPKEYQKQLVSAWTGVMGFSSDGLPIVGELPSSVTTRSGTGELAAVAFNGYGMPNCWLVGEALAEIALGKKIPTWLPGPYLLNDHRLQESLSIEKSVQSLGDFGEMYSEPRP